MEERQEAEEQFAGPDCHLMLATDAAGEGLNLQFCHIMVNYELPWNPNRLEQRIGRLHRYGQERDVRVYNIQVTNTREGIILTRLLRKLKTIEEQLGGYAPNILGLSAPAQAINLNKLSDLIINAIADDTPPEVTAEHVEQAVEARKRMGDQIENSLFMPLRHFHKAETDEVIERSRETMPTNADIETFVRTYSPCMRGAWPIPRSDRWSVSPPPAAGGRQDGPRRLPAGDLRQVHGIRRQGAGRAVHRLRAPVADAVIRDCRSRVSGRRGSSSAKLLPAEVLEGKAGLLFVYTLRFADAHDQTISETLVPVFVDARDRWMPRPGSDCCESRAPQCLIPAPSGRWRSL